MDVALTLAEAASDSAGLNPPMTEQQLTAIIRALGVAPAGRKKYTGRTGRPPDTYKWADITAIHAALLPWLVTHGNSRA